MENHKVLLNVEGMTCTNCALTVTKVLQKRGLKDVNVNFVTGEVAFEDAAKEQVDTALLDINRLGYRIMSRKDSVNGEVKTTTEHIHTGTKTSPEKKFYLSLIFTLPLFLHMVFPFSFLHEPVVQLILCLPVMIIGAGHFGKSAWLSVKSGVPNMDVLITIGSGAAFIYSIAGLITFYGTPVVSNYLFFETAATIITLVLLGNVIEQRSVKQTTTAIRELTKLQATKAKKVIYSEGGTEETMEVPVSEIQKGDLLLVNTGDKIPVDGKITWGNALINESMITGESLPVNKNSDDEVIGSTLVEKGSIKITALKVGNETALAKIIELVKNAQNSKPPIQQLGDKVSAVFVPVVIAISGLTLLISYFVFSVSLRQSLMSSIAVLVISCPCAMGLATPTAIMVGIGRAAKNGILIKGGSTLENFASVKTIVFDKTGTLTTGNFKIRKIHSSEENEEAVRILLYALEKHSSHPIARSIVNECKDMAGKGNAIHWKKIEEDKGIGINATDEEGNLYSLGSFQMVKHFHSDLSHNLYLLKNNRLLAAIDVEDEIKLNTKFVIDELKKQGIKTILVSGDRKSTCETVAMQLGIDEVYSEQLPAQKLDIIEHLSKTSSIAMVGDGINDAPALAKATVGVSLSNATQVAIQSAQIILLHGDDLNYLLKAIRISKHTLVTIKQNLFWAFLYNVIAIPIAACGLLSPMIGALSMAFSDVVVVGNSIRLKTKKIF
jgi:Cu+-exporting ATPase